MDIWSEIKESFKYGSSATRIIYINLAVFLAYKVTEVIFFLFADGESASFLIPWFSVPASASELVLKPWTLISYMFFHVDFLHILFNLVWLYWFSKIFLSYFDQSQLVGVYILGGLAGAFLFILAFNLFPVFNQSLPGSVCLGASAGVLAIVIAISAYVPNYTLYLLFLGPVKLKYIALVSIVIDIISIPAGNAGGHIAHLGGALFGFLFVASLKNKTDLTRAFQLKQWKWKNPFRRKSKLKVNYGDIPRDDYAYNARKLADQAEIDKILDKISKGGYDSLNKDEKDKLFRMGQKK